MRYKIQVKWYSRDRSEWYWRTICYCADAESCGLMERFLDTAGVAFRTEDVGNGR